MRSGVLVALATRFALVAALGVLASVGVAAPASAATPLFVRSAFEQRCLDQHYNAQGQPTTTVYAYYGPCHHQGNQQWFFDHIGNNIFKIVNARSLWCLSAPNGPSSQVYAEHCRDEDKQKWKPQSSPIGLNLLRNVLATDRSCMHVSPPIGVWMGRCNGDDATHNWYWQPD